MKLKWYTIRDDFRMFYRDMLCIQGTGSKNAITRAFDAMNVPKKSRNYNRYTATLVNYNITRQCEIL